MTLEELRKQLKTPHYQFADTLAFIEANYLFKPTAFSNGEIENGNGQNEGSCKVLGLALLEGLTDEEALLAFGEHYRCVLESPEGSDHQNIRSLQKNGLGAVRFEAFPLVNLKN